MGLMLWTTKFAGANPARAESSTAAVVADGEVHSHFSHWPCMHSACSLQLRHLKEYSSMAVLPDALQVHSQQDQHSSQDEQQQPGDANPPEVTPQRQERGAEAAHARFTPAANPAPSGVSGMFPSAPYITLMLACMPPARPLTEALHAVNPLLYISVLLHNDCVCWNGIILVQL